MTIQELSTASLSVAQVIEQRRSTKHFLSDPIPSEVFGRLIELTLLAPSSWNFQPWRIVAVKSLEQKAKLKEAAYNQAQIGEAPVTFVFAAKLNAWEETIEPIIEQALHAGAWSEKYGEYVRKSVPSSQKALAVHNLLREYVVKDAVIAATHCALAAESLGLGSTFMNGWIEEKVKDVIGVPKTARDQYAIAILLPVGYPDPDRPAKNPGRLAKELTLFSNLLST